MKIAQQQSQPESKPPRRISLGTLLATTFGLLIALAMAAVIALSIGANYRNTFSLLNLRAEELINSMEQTIEAQAERSEQALFSIQRLFAEGEFEIADPKSHGAFLRSLLIASPNIESFMVFDLDGNRSGISKDRKNNLEEISFDRLTDEAFLASANISPIRSLDDPIWGKPIRRASGMMRIVSLSLVRDGTLMGVAAAVMGTDGVNQTIKSISEQKGTVVFLLDPQNEVFAHSRMPQIFKSRPTYPISEIPDPVLRQLPTATPSARFDRAKDKGISIFQTPGFDGMLFLIKEIRKGDYQAISLGTYFKKGDVGEEVSRIAISALIGLAMLLLSLIIAVLLGRRLAKLMSGVSTTALQISEFNLTDISPLPGSRIREIDSQAKALNSVHTALTAFSRYVPRSLVKRLVLSGQMAPQSVQREVTVMFTDIVGFTALTERMDAITAARILNEHFDVICQIIENKGGTVDKFMGDCVMAFWGAPDADNAHAQNAVNAALEISEAFSDIKLIDGDIRGIDVKLRIGIHTGRVIVGDIGGADRRNYTIIGDTVNVAQRMEQLGKEFTEPEKVVIIASSTTVEKIANQKEFKSLGSWQVRGREQPVTIFAKGVAEENNLSIDGKIVQFPAS